MNNDLISRQTLKKHYAWWRETENGRKMADLFDEIVDAQPPADVVERKKGKWEMKWNGFFKMDIPCCSVCHKCAAVKTPVCPNCFARMEGSDE